MAETNYGTEVSSESTEHHGPAIILICPQLGENIGMAARAMRNCTLTDLRLVRPREGWLNDKAISASAGATDILKFTRVYDKVGEAIADLHIVCATTARSRDMTKPVIHPRRAALEIRAREDGGERCGFMFGREKSGLTNDDVSLADLIVEVPLNPSYSSLNLAQAVLVMSYEWLQVKADTNLERINYSGPRPATRAELLGMFEHLERELDSCGFLRVKEMRSHMLVNIRNMLHRACLTEQEVRTFHGIITELRYGGRSDRPKQR